jgi:beta-lactamase superfamily II metal-dependent hydrolase
VAVLAILLSLSALLSGCLFEPRWETPGTDPDVPVAGREMRVAVLDIGEGDAILVISPNDWTMLVDGGNSRRDATEVILPYLWENGFDGLDVLVLTHPDADHVGGLPTVLRSITVGTVVATGQVHTTQVYAEFLRELQNARKEQGTTVIQGAAGVEIPFDPDVELEVLGPSPEAIDYSEPNDASIVLRLTYGQVSVLLTGDAGFEQENWMVDQGHDLYAEILKVSHHGSRTGSSDDFLDSVEPEVALISCSADNQYGHPHDEVLDRLARHGVEVYRTDLVGTIEVVIDGGEYWVEMAR